MKEALKLALEALESCDEGDWSTGHVIHPSYDEDAVKQAITAITEALAQPEQEPVAKKMTAHRAVYFMERFKHEEKLLGPNEQAALDFVISMLEAQPEQEPVALETIYETIIQWDEGGGKRSRRELARRIVSLYTTPPQRKPLTYVDLRRIASQCGLGANEISAQAQAKVDNFARAIEQAHGIKE